MTIFKKILSKIKNKIRCCQKPKLIKLTYRKNDLKPSLHIGCGPINLEGWINIDARKEDHIHILTDKLDLQEFADNSVGEIYLCHVLEHFGFNEIPTILETFYRKLKPDGVLRVSVPDFNLIAQGYTEKKISLNSFKFLLMGGQDYQYNFHKSVFDHKELKQHLLKAGFSSIEAFDTLSDFGVDLGDWSTKTIAGHPVSLNLKATKEL